MNSIIVKNAFRAAIMFFVAATSWITASEAKGAHSSSSSGNKSVYVHGYVTKSGKVVAPYYRSAPGEAIHYNAATGSISSSAEGNQSNFSAVEVVGQKANAVESPAKCQYKAVMTDDDIQICKAEAIANGRNVGRE
jgi:hypothetical protein